MLYTVNLDKDNYILSVSHTKNDNVELDLFTIDVQYLNAYQLIDNVVVLNEEKKVELVAEEEREEKDLEIKELQKKLDDTDYIFAHELEDITALSNPVTFITDMIKVLVSYATKYKDVIAERKAWRERIEELQK